MAAPQVAALAALVGALNPRLTTREKLRIIKETGAGPGEWNPDLGWGILNAAAAIDLARKMDRLRPSSRVRLVSRRGRRVRLRFHRRDPGTRRGLIPSGVTRIELFGRRGNRPVKRLRRYRDRRAVTIRLRPGRWRLYTRAADGAGNVEVTPRRPDVRFRVRKPRR
jgi:serine protease